MNYIFLFAKVLLPIVLTTIFFQNDFGIVSVMAKEKKVSKTFTKNKANNSGKTSLRCMSNDVLSEACSEVSYFARFGYGFITDRFNLQTQLNYDDEDVEMNKYTRPTNYNLDEVVREVTAGSGYFLIRIYGVFRARSSP